MKQGVHSQHWPHLDSDVGGESQSVKGESCECSFPGPALLQDTVQLVNRQAVQRQVVIGVAQLEVAARRTRMQIQCHLNN